MNFLDKIIIKDEKKINMMSPLTWAYVGDSIYELYIRTYLANNTNLNPHKMHVESIKYVKAGAQYKILKIIIYQKMQVLKSIHIILDLKH